MKTKIDTATKSVGYKFTSDHFLAATSYLFELACREDVDLHEVFTIAKRHWDYVILNSAGQDSYLKMEVKQSAREAGRYLEYFGKTLEKGGMPMALQAWRSFGRPDEPDMKRCQCCRQWEKHCFMKGATR